MGRLSSRRRGARLRVTAALALIVLTSEIGTAQSLALAAPQRVEPPVGHSLTSRMAGLFHDLATDSLSPAEALFFPQSAYLALKRIPDARADYVDRLIGLFRLDVAVYHALLVGPGDSVFLGVSVNTNDAVWIQPGWCENSIGYWHLPGVRLVYRHDHAVHSVAVASLISWHGVWYVVHLGPNPRPRDVGTLDAPSLGHGVPGPAGGC